MEYQAVSTRTALPSGTVTFLFTDIEGSTRLAQQFPDEMPSLLQRHESILSQSIQAYNGHIFKIIGDAFCAAFHNTLDALNAALSAQRSLQHEKWGPAPVMVRMGIHTGLAQVDAIDDHAADYSGYMTLAHTQSVMASAHGGQVLLSNASTNLVQDNLPQGVLLRDMGEHTLKGELIRDRLWQLVAEDLRLEFPALKTLSTTPNNLPTQLTSFVGRQRELAQTKDMLAANHLLTLIGPGGTGKTRLTLELAAKVLPEFRDGAWLVELAPLADPALVPQTIATALGLRANPGALLEDQLTYYLHAKQLLVILDNCEHLVEACAQIAEHLLRNCPDLKLVASSREALGIAGETVFRVPPLALPEVDSFDLEVLHRSEAVQLFLARAAAVKPGFGLNGQNAQAVARICQRLDGIPLALELAAARVAMLSPQQIATRLDDRFRLLTGGSRTALPRQQTLRSLIDWSYDLLSEPERILFCQLAVFVGGWSLEAAEAICPGSDVFELLTQLVQKSLVAVDEREELAEARYRLLETTRQYARDRLLEMESVAQVRDRHLAYFLQFVETSEARLFGPERLAWIDRYELELDNFRAALQWGLEYDPLAALRLVGSLAWFLGVRGYSLEGHRWLKAAQDRAAALPEARGEEARQRQRIKAKGLLGISQLAYGLGNHQAGLEASLEAVQIYRDLEDRPNLAYALCVLGNMYAFLGDLAAGERALNEAIAIGREMGNKLILAYASGVLSHYVLLARGDFSRARAVAEESARYSREISMDWSVAQSELIIARIDTIQERWDEARLHALKVAQEFQRQRDPTMVNIAYIGLADIELGAGEIAKAREYLQQNIIISKELGHQAFVSHSLESFAFIAHVNDQPERAARLLGAAEAVREGLGTSLVGVDRLEKEYDRTTAWLHSRLDDSAYETCWSEGCDMGIDRAILYALEG